SLAVRKLVAFDENLNSFTFRPESLPKIARYLLSRTKSEIRWKLRDKSPLVRWSKRLLHPADARVPIYAKLAHLAGMHFLGAGGLRFSPPLPCQELLPGISVIIPTRDGRALLEQTLPLLTMQSPDQILVIDNGSSDHTVKWLAADYPSVEVLTHSAPLSFARAINQGLPHVRHRYTLLLNNDMFVAPNFLAPLEQVFATIPNLFCATAQIFFPPGQRREETGKAVFHPTSPTNFPLYCELPLAGEDQTWVLYGSGGCSLYDTAKLLALGGMNEIFTPAYVEDLDLGFRGWKEGWPSVFVSAAQAEHHHRSTTARYHSEAQLTEMVEINYLRFLASAIASPALFRRLWRPAIRRLHLTGSIDVLRAAPRIPWQVRRALPTPAIPEDQVLALTNGSLAVFPGRARSGKPVILIATAYLPYPLSHGGAVRIFNLIREASPEFDHILLAFTDALTTPAPELLALCCEITLVRREGSHYRLTTTRPDTVEEFDSLTFHAALRQTISKWSPSIVQLEWTQMAQYAPACSPVKTILVEHDITFDLQQQMLRTNAADHSLRTQLTRWKNFETAAWQQVSAVVTMSAKDRAAVNLPHAASIPNGVDTERFQPSSGPPEPYSLLFIGSFAHLPNRLGIEFFLREIWPLLPDTTTLHIVAGERHEEYGARIGLPRVTVEGFVPDVRPAYRRAAVVIAPLTVSSGTNIKILEAMAMGKAIVSTPAGINGLDVTALEIAASQPRFAAAVSDLLGDRAKREALGAAARQAVEAHYTWRDIAKLQTALYRQLINP
ncbi:MAG: glycosyltransferase, partial [Acidobacteriota bacterium]|nr:glycosyltransferase [Acidobacteriota bacterium]